MAQNEKKTLNLEDVERFGFVNTLNEDVTARTPHPEDSIFDGSPAATDAINSLGGVIANPSNVTIKWDGYPALIFGRNPEGRIAIMDKYMFEKNIMALSTQEWQEYDTNKGSGKLRPDLYAKLDILYKGLEPVVKGAGYYWGDLMYVGKPNLISGNYIFKPNVVEYHVPVQSSVGRIISTSFGGIAVHQHFDEFGGTPSPWNGEGLENAQNGIAILTPTMGMRFTLKDPVQLSRAAANAVKKYGPAVDDLMVSLPSSTKAALKTYFNKRITGQTDMGVPEWMNSSGKQYKGLDTLYSTNGDGAMHESIGYTALKIIWNSIYAYKLNLYQQLSRQVQGLEQYVNGQVGGEGFVYQSSHGPMKLVNRGQFSRALFAKNS